MENRGATILLLRKFLGVVVFVLAIILLATGIALAQKEFLSIVSKATGSAKAANAAAKKVILWFEVDPSHPESLKWFRRFTRSVPMAQRDFLAYQAAYAKLGADSKKNPKIHLRAQKYLEVFSTFIDNYEQVIPIVKAYGFPSGEFRRLWNEMVRENKKTPSP